MDENGQETNAGHAVIILGIDPGLAACGYGVVDAPEHGQPVALEFGVIATAKHLPQGERLKDIQESTIALIETWRPVVMVVERMIFTQARAHAQQTSEARGAVLAAAAHHGVPVVEYTPQEAKLEVTGSGRAEKEEVQEAIQALFDLPHLPRPNHAADALAMCVTYINRR